MTDTITHDKTPDTHSSIVGGSSASRILGCPGSVDLLAQIPEAVLKESSTYADEGTGLHEIMAYLVEHDEIGEHDIINDPHIDELWQRYALDDARLWDAVLPAWRAFNAYCDKLLDGEPEDAELRIRVESRVEMPGIDGAFGTCDVLIRAPSKTVVWDWKFGQGVPVLASYKRTVSVDIGMSQDSGTIPSEDEEYGNDQLMFYARAAMSTYPDYFQEDGDWPVDLVICQPRILEEELSTFETAVYALEGFRLDLVDAVEEALSGNGHKAKGSYCRFAKCKTKCPLWVEKTVDAAEVGEKLSRLQALHSVEAHSRVEINGKLASYPEALAAGLDLVDAIEPLLKEFQVQAHAFMEAGGSIPNYKLVPKRAGWDGWEDEKDTDDFLSRRKLSVDERRKPWSSITPAAARKLLKAKGDEKGVKLLEKYVKPGVSSGTTIAPGDDPRPAVEATATTVRNLAEKIASLGK